ncbi:hypothetical protein GPECTOR_8g306 [Gonium pectorale]|uniref:Uncharacterized protein n=1 Tax=Gonium pectorale TaxID=33097 RepID=A0A150GUB4_GONPE|nr:hypothetical protein GPECTOR_8g306 [Gonium pectorale]|eukprot:KXZ52930.1 hypothetical protein GPECTOR_8g306 [Gonium pectorale]
MTSAMTLLEDEDGDVIMVALYNYLPSGLAHLSGLAAMRVAARELPEGQPVAIIEPFMKIMADGQPGVRVDNPKEVVKLEALLPGNAAALGADGRAHFAAAQYAQAADCFRAALARMPDAAGSGSALLLSTLLNISIAHHRRGDAARSLQAAAAAVALRPDSSKAHYRCAVALARLRAPLAARRNQLGRDTASGGAATAASGSGGGDAAAAAAVARATAAKETGNALFAEGRWDEALERYREAVRSLVESLPAAALLADLAACGLQSAQPRQALAAATAAAVLQPGNAKAHHRRAQAALALGWFWEATTANRVGLDSADPRDTAGVEALRAMCVRFFTAVFSQDDVAAKLARLKSDAPLEWAALQKDERVPPFHKEFSRAGRWPPLCKAEECGSRLWEAYELCVSMSSHLLSMTHMRGTDLLELMMRRGSGYDPSTFQSFANFAGPAIPMPPLKAPPPQASAGSATTCGGAGDGPGVPHTAGPRVHVAVAFVDLGTLAAAVDLPEWDEHVEAAVREPARQQQPQAAPSGRAAACSPPPPPTAPLLRWVGYEASPHCVAKALVLERMMRVGGPAATEHVLQVWYSSVWTRGTDAAFRAAVTELLRESSGGSPSTAVVPAAATTKPRAGSKAAGSALAPEVAATLAGWLLREVGLAESRRRWLKDWTRTFCAVGALKEKCDRLALTEYLLTGQLPGLGPAGELVGSAVMFGQPNGAPERCLNESFLQALPQDEIYAARLAAARGGVSDGGGDSGSGGGSNGNGGGGSGGDESSGGSGAHPRGGRKGRTGGRRATGASGGGRGAGAASAGTFDIVTAAAGILRRRVQRMAALVAGGRVEVQALLRCVEPGDASGAASIAALSPDSISWSNLPDHLPTSPRTFHALARACSRRPPAAAALGAATVHYMHTINWTFDVRGSSHLDLTMRYLSSDPVPAGAGGTGGSAAAAAAAEQMRRLSGIAQPGRSRGSGSGGGAAEGSGMPYQVPEELSRRILGLVEGGRDAVREDMGRRGGDAAAALLLEPPVENPRNVADFGLAVRHHQAWASAFFAAGGLAGTGAGAGCWAEVTSTPTFSPLGRCSAAFSLAFSYGNVAP